jgi:hypothetical protein
MSIDVSASRKDKAKEIQIDDPGECFSVPELDS